MKAAPHSEESSSSQRPIGLFDSGLGGLTVFREVRQRFPHENLIYLGDTARTPYGSKGSETIIRYSRECARFLQSHEVKLLIVACNTASSLALDVLKAESPCPVIGTIDHAVESAVRVSRGKRIGIIGTEATISSGVYQQSLHRKAPGAAVFAHACPLFVPVVEQGLVEGRVVDAVVEHYLTPLRNSEIDTLILGCTHYPLLRASIQHFFQGEVQLVECAAAIADEVGELLARSGELNPSTEPGAQSCFVTDAVSPFDRLAHTFLGDTAATVARVDIPEIPLKNS